MLYINYHLNPHHNTIIYKLGTTIIIPILQMERVRHKECMCDILRNAY